MEAEHHKLDMDDTPRAAVIKLGEGNPGAINVLLRIVDASEQVDPDNLFGGLGKGARNLSIQSNLIHYKECVVTGSHGCVPRQHKIALDFIAAGYVPTKKVVTHRFSLDDILKAFETVEQRKGMKAVVIP